MYRKEKNKMMENKILMPATYTAISTDEMEYVDGGGKLTGIIRIGAGIAGIGLLAVAGVMAAPATAAIAPAIFVGSGLGTVSTFMGIGDLMK
ncbi:MAG: hypothetical protein LBM93_11245 [Oscillospiraceae bacterium]|jgi:hypothetical protein|nr:hypothetical protein [Oscillospiraceae bacterium]